MTYLNLYKTLSTRIVGDMLKPKVIKCDSFIFPKMSSLFFLGDAEILRYPKSGEGILSKQNDTVIYTIDTYDKPIGDPKRGSSKVENFNAKNKREDGGHKYTNTKAKLLLTIPSKLIIYNYGALPEIFRYKHNAEEMFNKYHNSINTLASNVADTNLTPRIKYVLIDLPHYLPKLQEFKKALKYSNKKVTSIFKDYKLLNVFEFYKWLDPEFKTNSVFNSIKNEDLNEVVFIFKFGNSMSMITANDIKGLVKDYNIDSKMTSGTSKTAKNLLLYYIINIIKSEPIPMSEIETKASYSDILVIGKDEFGNDEEKIKNIEDILNSEIEDTISREIDTNEILENKISSIDSKIKDIKVKTLNEIKEESLSGYDIMNNSLKDRLSDGSITDKEYARQIEILTKQKKSGILEKNKVTEEDITLKEEDKKIKDSEIITDKTMLIDTIGLMDKQYLDKVYKKDILNSIYAMQNSGIMIDEYNIEKTSSILGGVEIHELSVQPPNGRKIKLKINIPTVNSNGNFTMSGNQYALRKQRSDLPIKKIDTNKVSLTSYYGKLFITKGAYKKDDLGYAISKQLAKMNADEESKIRLLIRGEMKVLDNDLPLIYTTFSKYTKAFIYGQYRFNFDFDNRNKLLKSGDSLKIIEGSKYTLTGKSKNGYLLFDKNDDLILLENGKHTSLGNVLTLIEINVNKLPIEFSTIKLLKDEVPTVILFMYHIGLTKLIKILKVKFKSIEINKRYTLENDEYQIKLNNIKFIFNINDKLGSMILGGLKSFEKDLQVFDLEMLDTRDGVVNLMSQLGYNRRHVTEVKLLDSMFIDPITKNILEEMNEPTTFKGLLIRSNELLLTDNAKHPNSLDGMIIKGHERIAGMIYKELLTSVKDYENKNGLVQTKLAINPYGVWSKINEDSNVMLVDDLNPIAILKQQEEVSYLGLFGRDKATMSKPTRVYHESEVGIISEASKDSSDVGINTYLSANPNFKNLRGMTDNKDMKDINTTNKFSTSVLLSPGATQDDPKRFLQWSA